MITKELLEKPRAPQELTEFVENFVKETKKNREELHSAYLKKGNYKKFIDELVPLSIFCKIYYADEDVKISLTLGNQPYDAIVEKDGYEIEKIEITTPHNGAESAKESRRLVENRFSETSYEPGEDLEALRPFILAACKKKAKNKYPDCLLVISINYLPPFEWDKRLYQEKISSIYEEIKKITFDAKKVFLLEATQHRLHEIVR